MKFFLFFIFWKLFFCNQYGKTEQQIKEDLERKKQILLEQTQNYIKELEETKNNLSENGNNEGIIKNKQVQKQFKKLEDENKIRIEMVDGDQKNFQKILDLNQDNHLTDVTLVRVLDKMYQSAQEQINSTKQPIKNQTILLKDYSDVDSYMTQVYRKEIKSMTGMANGYFDQVEEQRNIETFSFTESDLEQMTDHSDSLSDSINDYQIDVLGMSAAKKHIKIASFYLIAFLLCLTNF